MHYTLVEREGLLYAKETLLDQWEPRTIDNWYLLTTEMTEFSAWFASEELMQKKIGCALFPSIRPATIWKDEQGWTYRLASSAVGEPTPAITEITPIAEPRQHGRKYSLVWKNGMWYKQTKNGPIKWSQ